MSERPRPAFLVTLLEIAVLLLVVAWVGRPYLEQAFFNLDDYRFVSIARDARAGEPGALRDALLVENRWDGDWWVEEGSFVRFFRPFNVASFALDEALWGLDARAFARTNLILHAACTVLAFLVLRRIVGGRVGPMLGGLVFAAHSCHAETLYFFAGRQGSMAGLAFLGALWLFLRGRGRSPSAGAIAVPLAYFAAVACKEWAAALPAALWLLDWTVPDEDGRRPGPVETLRRRLPVYAGCAAALVLYLVARHLALGEGGSGSRPFPYFFLPDREGFGPRTIAVALQYVCGLVAGTSVTPFLTLPSAFFDEVSAVELWASAVGLPVAMLLALRGRGGPWFALLLLGLLVPLLPVYSSGRYLYIPSFAWCGVLAALAQGLANRNAAFQLAGGLVLVSALAIPAGRHGDLLRYLPGGADAQLTGPDRLTALFEDADWLDGDAPVYLVDFPGFWLETQFLPYLLDVKRDGDVPPIHVLTQLPFEPSPPVAVERVAEDAVELTRGQKLLHLGDPLMDFDPRRVEVDERIEEEGYTAVVLGRKAKRASRVRIELDRPVDEVVFAQAAYVEGRGWTLQRIRPRWR